jgi:hypothetical protein
LATATSTTHHDGDTLTRRDTEIFFYNHSASTAAAAATRLPADTTTTTTCNHQNIHRRYSRWNSKGAARCKYLGVCSCTYSRQGYYYQHQANQQHQCTNDANDFPSHFSLPLLVLSIALYGSLT